MRGKAHARLGHELNDGGTATYVVTWLVGVTGNPLASTYYVMAANIVMLLAILAVPAADYGPSDWPPPLDRDV